MFPSGLPIDFGGGAAGGTFLYGGPAALVLTAENFAAGFGSAIDLLAQQDGTLAADGADPDIVDVMQGDLVVASVLMTGGVAPDLFSAAAGPGGPIVADSYATPGGT